MSAIIAQSEVRDNPENRVPAKPIAQAAPASAATPTPTPTPAAPAASAAGAAANGSQLPSFCPAEFNIGSFRLNQDFAQALGGERVITTIPVRKPSKEAWFRTHPNQDFRLPTAVIELREQSETYLVDSRLWAALSDEPTFVGKLLIPTLTRQGDLILWPIRLPGPDGRLDDWSESAMRAANLARDRWVRMSSRRQLGAYEAMVMPGVQPVAEWPDMSLTAMIEIAFRNRIINSLDHPVIRQLRGVA